MTLKLRYADFTTITRSRTFDLPTCDERAIAACARDLLRRTEAAARPVRLLGVAASNLVRGEVWQLPLFEADGTPLAHYPATRARKVLPVRRAVALILRPPTARVAMPGLDIGGTAVLRWALIFLVVALIAAVLGFGGIAGGAAEIAKILFFLFLVVFVDLADHGAGPESLTRAGCPPARAKLACRRPLSAPRSSPALTGLFVLASLYTLYFARAFLLPVVLALPARASCSSPVVRGLKRLRIPEGLGRPPGARWRWSARWSLAGYYLAGPAFEWMDRAPGSMRQLETSCASSRRRSRGERGDRAGRGDDAGRRGGAAARWRWRARASASASSRTPGTSRPTPS